MLSSPFSAHNPFMHSHYKCKSRLEIAIKLQHLLHRSPPSSILRNLLFKNSNWTLVFVASLCIFQLNITHTPCGTAAARPDSALLQQNPLKTYSIKLQAGQAATNRRQIRVVKMQSKWRTANAINCEICC